MGKGNGHRRARVMDIGGQGWTLMPNVRAYGEKTAIETLNNTYSRQENTLSYAVINIFNECK